MSSDMSSSDVNRRPETQQRETQRVKRSASSTKKQPPHPKNRKHKKTKQRGILPHATADFRPRLCCWRRMFLQDKQPAQRPSLPLESAPKTTLYTINSTT